MYMDRHNYSTRGSVEEPGTEARLHLDGDAARAVAVEVATAVKGWRAVAAGHGLSSAEITRMSSAFEHGDLAAALAAN